VTIGIWISPDLERNEREIQKAIELANNSRSVVRVVVGNEALFREEITPEDLIVLLDRVRAAVKVPGDHVRAMAHLGEIPATGQAR
jgi:exo-beta-1,3-glucanase (GH17 family)